MSTLFSDVRSLIAFYSLESDGDESAWRYPRKRKDSFLYYHKWIRKNKKEFRASSAYKEKLLSLFGKAKGDMDPATIVRLTQIAGELRRIEEEKGRQQPRLALFWEHMPAIGGRGKSHATDTGPHSRSGRQEGGPPSRTAGASCSGCQTWSPRKMKRRSPLFLVWEGFNEISVCRRKVVCFNAWLFFVFVWWRSTPMLTGDRLLSMLSVFVWLSFLCLHVWYGKTPSVKCWLLNANRIFKKD